MDIDLQTEEQRQDTQVYIPI